MHRTCHSSRSFNRVIVERSCKRRKRGHGRNNLRLLFKSCWKALSENKDYYFDVSFDQSVCREKQLHKKVVIIKVRHTLGHSVSSVAWVLRKWGNKQMNNYSVQSLWWRSTRRMMIHLMTLLLNAVSTSLLLHTLIRDNLGSQSY